MSDPTTPRDAAAETSTPAYAVDLSTNAARGTRPRRSTPKGFVPVVQKTINLSTKKEPAAQAEPARGASAPQRTGTPRRSDAAQNAGAPRSGKRDDARRDARRTEPSGGGTSLADLLDAATLARLRGSA